MAAIDGRDRDTKRENEGDEEGETERATKEGKQRGRSYTTATETKRGRTRVTKEGTMGRAAIDGRDRDKRRGSERG